MKPLKKLIKDLEIIDFFPKKHRDYFYNLEIKGITENSKEVESGYIFVARKGTQFNGEEFIEEAINKGAVVILKESPIKEAEKFSNVFFIQVKNIKKALSRIVLNFYSHPEKELILIGVTGTNGKTSVSYFTKNILNKAGLKTGYIGTIFYETDRVIPALETTPSILKIVSLLKEMVDKNFKACVIEVSSHALHQDRILGLTFDIAAFTNLSRDHLDYHQTMESYYQAKKKLFTCYLKPSGKAVVSQETEYGKRLTKELKPILKDRLILVNNEKIKAEILDKKNGLFLLVKFGDKEYKISTQLYGDYQAKNIATLCGILLTLSYKEDQIISYLKDLKNPLGRLELVTEYKGAKIFVDYAHTPSALEEVLKSLKSLKDNRLIVVFGCGGNRDKGKRPLMGQVASVLADEIILTSDNPRFEDPLEIIEDIKKGINGSKPYKVIPDRKEALKEAIKSLKKGDVLVVAGKGHETYQEIKGKRYSFSDQEEVLKIIREIGG